MRMVALGLIRLYQMTLSRMIPGTCRFIPSCSHYGYEAIEKYGLLRGGWLAARRIACCHPWHAGGYDPIPEASSRFRGRLECNK